MKIQLKNLAIYSGLLIMTVISLVSCGNVSKNKESHPGKETMVAEEVAETTDDQTPGVSFKDKNGEIVSLSSLKGNVVFINFWATWCPPCIAEMPSIQELYTAFKDNEQVVFLMVDVDNKPEKSNKFMENGNYDLPVHTPASAIPPSFLGGAIPTTLVLNKKGEVVFKHEGMGDYGSAEFQSFIGELAAE